MNQSECNTKSQKRQFLMIDFRLLNHPKFCKAGAALGLYIKLRSFSNSEATKPVNPSCKNLAKFLDCSENTITNQLKHLVKLGLIAIERRFNDSSIYTFPFESALLLGPQEVVITQSKEIVITPPQENLDLTRESSFKLDSEKLDTYKSKPIHPLVANPHRPKSYLPNQRERAVAGDRETPTHSITSYAPRAAFSMPKPKAVVAKNATTQSEVPQMAKRHTNFKGPQWGELPDPVFETSASAVRPPSPANGLSTAQIDSPAKPSADVEGLLGYLKSVSGREKAAWKLMQMANGPSREKIQDLTRRWHDKEDQGVFYMQVLADDVSKSEKIKDRAAYILKALSDPIGFDRYNNDCYAAFTRARVEYYSKKQLQASYIKLADPPAPPKERSFFADYRSKLGDEIVEKYEIGKPKMTDPCPPNKRWDGWASENNWNLDDFIKAQHSVAPKLTKEELAVGAKIMSENGSDDAHIDRLMGRG